MSTKHNNNSDDFSHRSGLNCARDFHERQQTPRLLLPTPIICHYCRAKLFHGETRNFCCNGGKIVLPEVPVPSELYNLFTDQSAEGRIFRQNIRAFNHIFSFTSLGAKLYESVAGRQGVYAFRAHGTMYHKIGTLLPSPGTRPRYIQMFIYDTEHEIENRLLENNGLDRGLVEKIKHILDVHNPFVQTLRQLAQRDDILDCKLLIKERPTAHSRYALPTASQVAAIVIGGDEVADTTNRDIIVQTIGGQLMNVKEFSGYYDPLQYPCYFLMEHMDGIVIVVQLMVPESLAATIMLICCRFIRTHQQDIRAELYQGLQDCLMLEKMMLEMWDGVLSYRHHLLEALEICINVTKTQCQWFKMTCNPSWEEIQNELKPGQTPQDRPDLLTRIFRAKFEELKKDIYTKDENDKLNTPDDYDHIVRAEIPDKNDEPMLYEAVMRHMIHGPCGEMNVNAPCMKNGTCKKNYPKPFAPCTIQGTDSYPIYRRRDDNRSISLDRNCDVVVDNGWVVPYNPWLLLKYDCHINVEIYSNIKSIKYLYKYVYKGPDCVVFEVRPGPNYDEISQYVDGRWICAPEALWKIYKFPMSKIYPSLYDYKFIFQVCNRFNFYSFQRISDVLSDERNSRTMLTEFFRVYNEGQEPNQYLYSEFPKYYRWMSNEKQAAEKRGFLEEDDSIRQCLSEARAVRMPSALRSILLQHKRSLKEFDLPQIAEDYQDLRSISSLIEDELSIPIPLDDLNANQTFFVDGPGGTGKTFYTEHYLQLFNVGFIMVATATSGIAAIQLPGGRTAHSKLKIPIKLDSSSRCNFSKQSEVCQLLDRAATIIWDEAPMADKKAIETVDRTLREMFGVDLPFGGKIMILGGDFRQVVPVVVGVQEHKL
ncbi:UNVERIFIED_CONTAM: hypothetical protein Sangu_3093100 [Sesamum angustifolium]|uniref:ATP-dependent DNA helicase n=1 Tax=Sesamum angustifolium TaxID=2727405 RepID=A0AAW2K913_9LAMI